MLSAVIFDFDGIIVDSEPLHFRAFNEVLQENTGKSISWDDYCTTYIGFDDRDAFREIHKAFSLPLEQSELEHLIDQKAEVMQRYIEDGEAVPLPGAVELIKSIPGRLPLALCSGALRSDIQPIIEQLGIDKSFDTIVTAEDTPKSKPDPAPYRLALEKLGIDDPSCTIAIEDTPAGIMSAKGAGMKVLAVTNSYESNYLTEADAVTDSLSNVTRPMLENIVL